MIESTTQVPQTSKEFMKSIFTTGIPINLNVFNQDRIRGDIQADTEEMGLFTFCPTCFVTTQMFQAIKDQRTNALFMGQKGISKSVSVILYSILSNLIVDYKFKTFGRTPTSLG